MRKPTVFIVVVRFDGKEQNQLRFRRKQQARDAARELNKCSGCRYAFVATKPSSHNP